MSDSIPLGIHHANICLFQGHIQPYVLIQCSSPLRRMNFDLRFPEMLRLDHVVHSLRPSLRSSAVKRRYPNRCRLCARSHNRRDTSSSAFTAVFLRIVDQASRVNLHARRSLISCCSMTAATAARLLCRRQKFLRANPSARHCPSVSLPFRGFPRVGNSNSPVDSVHGARSKPLQWARLSPNRGSKDQLRILCKVGPPILIQDSGNVHDAVLPLVSIRCRPDEHQCIDYFANWRVLIYQ